MSRVTLRLPDDLHRRLRSASRRAGTSVNQLVSAALAQTIAREERAGHEGSSRDQEADYIRTALAGSVVEVDVSLLPPHLRPGPDLPDRETFVRSLHKLSPPLSAKIVADREEASYGSSPD